MGLVYLRESTTGNVRPDFSSSFSLPNWKAKKDALGGTWTSSLCCSNLLDAAFSLAYAHTNAFTLWIPLCSLPKQRMKALSHSLKTSSFIQPQISQCFPLGISTNQRNTFRQNTLESRGLLITCCGFPERCGNSQQPTPWNHLLLEVTDTTQYPFWRQKGRVPNPLRASGQVEVHIQSETSLFPVDSAEKEEKSLGKTFQPWLKDAIQWFRNESWFRVYSRVRTKCKSEIFK